MRGVHLDKASCTGGRPTNSSNVAFRVTSSDFEGPDGANQTPLDSFKDATSELRNGQARKVAWLQDLAESDVADYGDALCHLDSKVGFGTRDVIQHTFCSPKV